MTTLAQWIIALLLIALLSTVTLQIPGNTGYPDMGTSPGGHGGSLVVTPSPPMPLP